MKKNKIMCVCVLLIWIALAIAPVALAADDVIIPVETLSEEDTAVIQSYIYEWRYKKENGHIYKRLYNCTKSCWVGDWILVY